MPKPKSKPTPAALASEIRDLRIRLQLSQTKFARELGVSQQKLSDWENGKRLRPVVEAMRLVQRLKRSR